MNQIVSSADYLTKSFFLGLGFIFFILVVWWFYRVATLVEIFLKGAEDVLGERRLKRARIFPFYSKEELKGLYKGREVIVGVIYTGFKGEYLPLPYIRIRLKETMGYNINRLPQYAFIEKNFLIFKVKLSVLWGVFDQNFPHVFDKSYLVVALEKLLSTAEDVERGRTLKEFLIG